MTCFNNRKNPGNIVSELVRFSLPLILSGILQQLYSWADAFIVGNVEGEQALAAIGATGTLNNFALSMITGFTVGLAILFAQKYGAKELDFIPRGLGLFSVLLGGIVIVLAGAGMILTLPLLELMETTPDTIDLAAQYLKIIFAGLPFLAVYNVYSAALRGVGDSKAPFLAVFVSSAVNVVLDIVLVAVLRFGVAGAAYATVFSQMAMTVFMVVYAVKKHPLLRFRLSRSLFDVNILKQGTRLGIPPMIQSSVNGFGGLLLQNFMNGFGTQTVAAVTTVYRIDSIILLPIVNLGSGISTLTAQSHGAGNKKRAGRIFMVGMAVMTVVSLLLTVLIFLAGAPLIALFGVSEAVVVFGEAFFRGLALFYPVFGLATAVRSYLEGIGDVSYSSAIGIITLEVRIAGSYVLADVFGNMVIAYAEAIAWGLMLVLYALRAYQKRRK